MNQLFSEAQANPALELTLRGVELSDETVFYVRRCCRRTANLAGEPARWRVRLERREGTNVVHASVLVKGQKHVTGGEGDDLDELIATSNAFAVLEERLAQRSGDHLRERLVDVAITGVTGVGDLGMGGAFWPSMSRRRSLEWD